MKPKIDWIEKRHALRRAADAALSSIRQPEGAAPPMDVVLHELLVHKVELEMQIEELKRAHMEMEVARNHDAAFYEFAPVGYVALNREGVISEINQTGAALLGVGRAALINRNIAEFISQLDRHHWFSAISGVMDADKAEPTMFMLEMLRADGTSFNAYFECRSREPMVASSVLHFAVFDADKIKQAEMQMLQIRTTRKPDAGMYS
jgi:PAS domain S-box-containing protein